MRGADETNGSLFSYVEIEARIPARHPLRLIRASLLRILFSVRSERELMEQMD